MLIFVAHRQGCDELSTNLCNFNFLAGSIHGEKTQEERDEVIAAFKSGIFPILVATDVAARGLDIPQIKTVVNFDVARDIDAHVHRIGRTGRAGAKDGVAYTLITAKEINFATHLVRNLESANQKVPPELLELAMKNPRFRKQRNSKKQSKGFASSRWQKFKSGGSGIGYNSDEEGAKSGLAPEEKKKIEQEKIQEQVDAIKRQQAQKSAHEKNLEPASVSLASALEQTQPQQLQSTEMSLSGTLNSEAFAENHNVVVKKSYTIITPKNPKPKPSSNSAPAPSRFAAKVAASASLAQLQSASISQQTSIIASPLNPTNLLLLQQQQQQQQRNISMPVANPALVLQAQLIQAQYAEYQKRMQEQQQQQKSRK